MSSVSTGGGGNDAPAVPSSTAATSNGPSKEGGAAVSSSSAVAAPGTTDTQQPSSSAQTTGPNAEEQEPQLLVREFPPPPNYYRLASIPGLLTKPTIPKDAIARGTHKARKESERLRQLALEAHQSTTGSDGAEGSAMMGVNHTNNNIGGVDENDDDSGDVTAIFGEILEDPTLLEPVEACPEPTKIRDEVKRLNRTVLQLFISLTQDLGGNSSTAATGESESETIATKTQKDLKDLSYNILLMLQETNKFREHQSRELLIELLEDQLRQRLQLIDDLEQKTELASSLLSL